MPYVSNEERIRLGVHQYGSDVPQDVLDAAEAAFAGTVDAPPAEEPPAPPKRARTSKGQYQADDPNTAAVNEAYQEG